MPEPVTFMTRFTSLPTLVGDQVREWSRDRVWWYRLPLLLWMIWLALRLTGDRNHQSLFSGINLGIHEMGHLLFGAFGDTLTAFGGSLLQCLAPILAAIVLLRVPDWFGLAFCATWLGTNLCYVAGYMADARARAWPLLSVGGGEVYHDWEFLFGNWGLLEADTTIAGLVTLVAVIVLWGSVAFAGWILWTMARSTHRS